VTPMDTGRQRWSSPYRVRNEGAPGANPVTFTTFSQRRHRPGCLLSDEMRSSRARRAPALPRVPGALLAFGREVKVGGDNFDPSFIPILP
jgi:hypothetical protein